MSIDSEQTRISAFFDRQRTLLQTERAAEIEQSSLLLSKCSPKLLEQKGLALLGLGVVNINVGLGGKSLVELERPSAYHTSPLFPPHSFRPGDLARIEENVVASKSTNSGGKKGGKTTTGSNTKSQASGVEGVVYKVTNTRIIIAIDPAKNGGDDADFDIPERCRVSKLANSITFDRMDKAVEDMAKNMLGTAESSASPSALQRVLFGISAPSERQTLKQPIKYYDETLNPSQRAAVALALESPEIALIHGPPGTGKTHTLVEIILQMVLNHSLRILICGASNLSVDNILERLIPYKKEIPFIRLGHPARVLTELYGATLDAKAEHNEEKELVKDVKKELEETLSALTGKGKGSKAKIRGAERRKMWEDVKELRREFRKREGAVVKNIVSEAKIVLATCHGAGSRQLMHKTFDVVIIDEAAQAIEAVCWIPILKASKLILAGDNLQLPPTVISSNDKNKKKQLNQVKQSNKPSTKASGKQSIQSSTQASISALTKPGYVNEFEDSDSDDDEEQAYGMEKEPHKGVLTNSQVKAAQTQTKTSPRTGFLVPSKSLEITLFDRMEKMWGEDIKQMLVIQYRMNATICDFPSKTLYSSKLVSAESVATRLLADLPQTEEYRDTIEGKDTLVHPVVFFDTAGCEYFERVDNSEGDGSNSNDEGSKCNVNEAEVVKKWVEELISCGIQPNQIAIITPYQAQLTLLSSLLLPGLEGLEIGTVDGMQGREKEAVILSLVRSNDKREVGFLKEKRRMNVAMTRPKRHLCVVGDSSTLKHGSKYLNKWMEWLETNADVRFAADY